MRQFKGESPIAVEVVTDEALVQDNGIDLIVAELDRCWEVTQDQVEAQDREGSLRDPEGIGNYLPVLRRTKKAQLSTVGSCVGDSASGDQGVRENARSETHGKQRQR